MARRRAAAWLGCAVAWCSCCAADDQLELSLVLGNVTLPHDRAVMHCRWFEIAALVEGARRPALVDRPLAAVAFGIALHSARSAAIVHHANIFMCAGRASERQFPHARAECSAGGGVFVERPKGGGGLPCLNILASYDRGAAPFTFPDDVGVRLGPGTPYTHLLLQVHYLHDPTVDPTVVATGGAPTAAAPPPEPLVDGGTGMWLRLSATPRARNARMIGLMDTAMVLPPAKRAHTHAYSVRRGVRASARARARALSL